MLLEAINETNFWDSIRQGSYRRKEGGRILTVTWLNQNEVIFKERSVSTDSVVHEIEGLMAS